MLRTGSNLGNCPTMGMSFLPDRERRETERRQREELRREVSKRQ